MGGGRDEQRAGQQSFSVGMKRAWNSPGTDDWSNVQGQKASGDNWGRFMGAEGRESQQRSRDEEKQVRLS